jgi:hypothetical protein
MGGVISYCAYGSNCNLSVLHRYLIQHDVTPTGIVNLRRAHLEGHAIRTNYLMSSRYGAANIEPAKNGRVEGLLMEITPDVHRILRRKEGCPHRYREINVCVHLPRRGQLILAMTYVVTDAFRLSIDMPVHPIYRDTVLAGARASGFSQKYQQHLSRLLCTA